MTVLVRLNSLELGGTQLNALDFARCGPKHGVRSVLVGYRWSMPSHGPSLVDVAADHGVTVNVIDEAATVLEAGRDLQELANRHDADLVHTYSAWSARQAFWGPCLFGTRPLVMTVYEMFVPPTVYPADPLIVGTRYLVEDLEDRRGMVRLISPPVDLDRDDPNAVSVEAFVEAEGLESDTLRIVTVSRLSDQMKARSIELSIRAVENLGFDAQMVVVGTGDAEDRLRGLATTTNSRLGREAVVFTGAMADPRAAYASADIVIGMGGSAARALAFGKPLIVAGEAGWFSTFAPETSALLFRNSFWSAEAAADPVTDLIEQINRLAESPSLRAELGDFGRRFATHSFGLEAMTARLAETYRAALREHRRRHWFTDLRIEMGYARARVGCLGRRIAAGQSAS